MTHTLKVSPAVWIGYCLAHCRPTATFRHRPGRNLHGNFRLSGAASLLGRR